jgi:non-canonical (house-cleaning) NTP pyrophosphatase
MKTLSPYFPEGTSFEIIGVEVPSGVGHTPSSREELMHGARGRAEALVEIARSQQKNWKYFVGLEGGLDVVSENGMRLVFLESWAHVEDDTGRSAFGHAGGILLPEALAAEVLDRGTELAVAIDSFAAGQGIRDTHGAWGVFTKNLITREDAFHFALINAFAPFFNAEMYGSRADVRKY